MSAENFAVELGATFRHFADQSAKFLTGQTASSLFPGPTIPYHIKEWSKKDMAGAALAATRLAQSINLRPPTAVPLTAAIALTQVAAFLKPGGYDLHQVGLNPERMLKRGEWHRLVTSQLINATAVPLIDNASDLYDSASHLERRWGWKGLLGALGAVTTLGQSLYVCLTAAAKRLAPTSALASQYTSAYGVGADMAAIGLSILAGYDDDVELSLPEDMFWGGRYRWGGRVFMVSWLAPATGQSREAHICAVVAGLVCVYAFGAAQPTWRQRAGLGWKDVAGQSVMLGLLYLAAYGLAKYDIASL